MKKALWLLVLLLGTAVGKAQQPRTLKDVVYGKIGERELTLDAYLWDGATLAPAVVYIHGGGWRNGDKSRLPDFLQEALFQSGISLISISYRLSGEAVHHRVAPPTHSNAGDAYLVVRCNCFAAHSGGQSQANAEGGRLLDKFTASSGM